MPKGSKIAAISSGIGSQVQKPLALVVVGGMALAPTLILLVLRVLIGRFSRHVGPEDRGDHDVASGLEPAVGAQADAVAQAVERQHLIDLAQAHFPRRARIFDAGLG